jgi:hypothetical protein
MAALLTRPVLTYVILLVATLAILSNNFGNILVESFAQILTPENEESSTSNASSTIFPGQVSLTV